MSVAYVINESVLMAAWGESFATPNEDEDDYLRLNNIDPQAARSCAASAIEAARATGYDYDDAVTESFLIALDMGVRIGRALGRREATV